MKQFEIPRGATVRIGRAARPIAPEMVAAIAGAVATVPGVVEAHLPQCQVPSLGTSPAQVLVLVLAADCRAEDVMPQLEPLLHAILPPGISLDVWPLNARNSMLPAIRGTDCRLYAAAQPAAPRRRWWQF